MGAPPHGDQVPPLKEDSNVEQAPTNPPPLTDDDISDAQIQLSQATTVQCQAMTTQINQEDVPHPHQEVTAMASHLRDSNWMNPSTFYRSKVEEEPQEFIDEVYKILLAMGLSISEKSKLTTYQLNDVY